MGLLAVASPSWSVRSNDSGPIGKIPRRRVAKPVSASNLVMRGKDGTSNDFCTPWNSSVRRVEPSRCWVWLKIW